jgi:hypothetical protein
MRFRWHTSPKTSYTDESQKQKINMKTFFLTILTLALLSCGHTVIKNDARIHFENKKHDFGKLSLKKEAQTSFQFTNSGSTPLVIFDVMTSCGCTVPEWTKSPVNPGDIGDIKIIYDADFPGAFHKTITVYYNGEASPETLSINGQVEYSKNLEIGD